MVELDPDNTEWHYCLHLVERYKREAADKYGPVTQEEKDTTLRAMKCPGASQDPRILNGYISCLADIVRTESRTRSYGPFRFGNETFGSFSEAVTVIRSYAE